MPRKPKTPQEGFLALSPASAARALGIRAEVVQDAILTGRLGPVRQCGVRKRIAVSDIINWFETWPLAQRRKVVQR
jgi:hypothetical protein